MVAAMDSSHSLLRTVSPLLETAGPLFLGVAAGTLFKMFMLSLILERRSRLPGRRMMPG